MFDSIKLMLPPALLGAAVDLRFMHHETFAWAYPIVLNVAEFFTQNEYIILGADVYFVDKTGLPKVTSDSMYYDSTDMPHDCELSFAAFEKYIAQYVMRNGDSYLFSLVLCAPNENDEIEHKGKEELLPKNTSHMLGNLQCEVVSRSTELLTVSIIFTSNFTKQKIPLHISTKALIDVAIKLEYYVDCYPETMKVQFGQRNNMQGKTLFLSVVSVDSYSGLVCVVLDNVRHETYDERSLKANAILTEIGLLEQFGKKLSQAVQFGTAESVSLM